MDRLIDAAEVIVLVAGRAEGIALVTDEALSLWGGLHAESGEITDRRHPLSGVCLTGRIFVLPSGRGSCSASGVLLEAIRYGTAPAGFIVSSVDPIIGLGAVLGDELYGTAIPVVAIEEESRASIHTGDRISIQLDGAIEITSASDASAPGLVIRS